MLVEPAEQSFLADGEVRLVLSLLILYLVRFAGNAYIVVFREFGKLDQEHGEQRPGFTTPLAPDLASACTGKGMLKSQTDTKR